MDTTVDETISDIMESLCADPTSLLEDTDKEWDRCGTDTKEDIDQLVNDFMRYWRKHD